jgi:endonuclease/exonuclease/phosphatase family metal-dependent hydrolase
MSKRLISLILVLILLITALVSCKKEPAGDDSESSNISNTAPESETDAPEPFYEISVSELENYSIVYSEDVTDEVMDAVNTLASALSMKFGILMRTKDDNPVNYKGESQIGDYEIIIGDTRREESAEFLSELEYSDRGYKIIGKKIVIASHDSHTTAMTVVEFSSIVRRTDKNAEVFYNSDMDNIILGSYTYGTISLYGADISEYRIVYPDGKNFEHSLAKKLRRAIAEECGSILPVVSDKESTGDREIIVGNTSRQIDLPELSGITDGRGLVTASNGNICLCGNSALGNAAAVEAFIDSFAGGEKTDELKLNVQKDIVTDSSPLSSMSFNISTDSMNDARAERVLETIVRYLPDTVGLQECSNEWKEYLLESLGDYYGYVGIGRDAEGTGLSTAILYAKERVVLKESATKWLTSTPDQVSKLDGADANYTYTYALFEKNGGESFMLINTQLGATSAIRTEQAKLLLELMYENREKAIILTGDLNCVEGSEEFNALVCEFMRHAAAITGNAKLGSATHGQLSDTILVYDKYVDVSYMEVASKRIDGAFASSSFAAYAEYIINYNGTSYTESGVTSNGQLTWQPDRDGDELPPYIPFD